jgi:hypothetical protein
MGDFSGNYSRNMSPFSRRRQYIRCLTQQGKPVSDADLNDSRKLQQDQIRAFIKEFAGSVVFTGDSFKLEESVEDNDFIVNKGSVWLNGCELFLQGDANYKSSGVNDDELNLHSISTGLSASTLTDSSMNWVVNELVGRQITPNIQASGSFVIIANTETVITIAAGSDMTTVASEGDSYRVELSTPTAARVDSVFVNYYDDEIDSSEDPTLLHAIGSGLELDRRVKGRTIIMVQEGADSYVDYQDSDGNQHYMLKIGTLDRTVSDHIPIGEIEDSRATDSTDSVLDDIVTDQVAAITGKVAITANDATPDFVNNEIQVVSPLVKSVLNPSGDENLQISISSPNDPNRILVGTNPPTWATSPSVKLNNLKGFWIAENGILESTGRENTDTARINPWIGREDGSFIIGHENIIGCTVEARYYDNTTRTTLGVGIRAIQFTHDTNSTTPCLHILGTANLYQGGDLGSGYYARVGDYQWNQMFYPSTPVLKNRYLCDVYKNSTRILAKVHNNRGTSEISVRWEVSTSNNIGYLSFFCSRSSGDDSYTTFKVNRYYYLLRD